MDALYELPFTRRPHPVYREAIPAYTMIKDSITVVRGCPGGCTFCGACIEVCPYDARSIHPVHHIASVNAALCQKLEKAVTAAEKVLPAQYHDANNTHHNTDICQPD